MSFVALATCLAIPEPDTDEPFLLAALDDAGIPARVLAWDDPAVDWTEPVLTVIRSTWNYYLKPEAYLSWVDSRGAALENPGPLVRWNFHKQYLAELEADGVPVVPTLWLPRGAPFHDSLAARGWRDVVVKPAVSAGSYRTQRLTGPPFDEAALESSVATGDTMVQPYVTSVETHGERSLVVIDGEITHAIRKSPRFHGQDERVVAVDIEADERAAAVSILERLTQRGHRPLYARIDLVRSEAGDVLLSELELMEPSLFLGQSQPALDRFVTAIGARYRARLKG